MWFWIAPPCCAGGRELAVEADQVEAGPHRVGEQEAAQTPDELDA
jgi:hypothetical protein